MKTVVLISALFLSQITAQGYYDDARPYGSNIGIYDPRPFSGTHDLALAFSTEEWDSQKEEVPYTYPWENEIGQTAQQMAAIISLLQSEGLTSIDIELFLDEIRKAQQQGRK